LSSQGGTRLKEGINKWEKTMFKLKKVTTGLAITAVGLSFAASAWAETVIRVQSVISAKADEVTMLKDFAKDVFDLTDGEVKLKCLQQAQLLA